MTEIPDEVEERLNDLEGRVDALHKAREYLLEQVEKLEEKNEQLRERLDDVDDDRLRDELDVDDTAVESLRPRVVYRDGEGADE